MIMEGINVLSLFDGMSCGRIALQKANIDVNNYYASELDKYAIKVTQANWPETIQMGDVTKWREWDIDWASIDLLIGGSPCQGFSFAGKQLAFDDPRSALFFEYLNILNHIKAVNPSVKFFLENVRMKKEHLELISKFLNVEPVFINSNLVSAQNRQRFYWSNWTIEQPKDENVLLDDVLQKNEEIEGKFFLSEKGFNYMDREREPGKKRWNWVDSLDDKKSKTLTAVLHKGVPYGVIKLSKNMARRYTPIECERLQTVPDNFTNHVSNTQRYKMLGNGWTVDVVAHIFKGLVV